jgi:hypothetical protein
MCGGYNITKSFKIIKICRKVIFLKRLLLGIFSLGIIMFARPGEVGKKYIGETNGYCPNGVVLEKWEIERVEFSPITKVRVKYEVCKLDGLRYKNIIAELEGRDIFFDSFLKNYVEIVDSPTVVDYDKRILYLRIWN